MIAEADVDELAEQADSPRDATLLEFLASTGARAAEVRGLDTDDVGADGRPEDCLCWDVEVDLPCWPCWRAGHRRQNPAKPEQGED